VKRDRFVGSEDLAAGIPQLARRIWPRVHLDAPIDELMIQYSAIPADP
jgi:hypothetical protein